MVARASRRDNGIEERLHPARKSGFSTIREATAITSFGSAIPDLFNDATKPTPNSKESCFNCFKTYKEWDENVDIMLSHLRTAKDGLSSAISSTIPASNHIYNTYELSVEKSSAYLRGAINTIVHNTKSLSDLGLPQQRAYVLATHLQSAAFHELFKSRVGVAYLFNTSDMPTISALVWYHNGLTLDRQAKFLADDFKGDAVISSEYVKFMVENNNSEDVSTFQDQVTNLKKKINECNASAESAKKAASNASSKADIVTTLKLRVEKLIKLEDRVRSLENK